MNNMVQNEVLQLITIDNLTISKIAIKRNTTIQAVYKIVKKLKEKGLLQGFNGGGLISTTTQGGGGVERVYYRLHGLQYDITILHSSGTFSFAVTKGNSIRLLNNTIIFYKEKLEIYQDKESSFTGDTIEECFAKAIEYFNKIIYKIESRYNITIVKEGYHNIKIVNGHMAEVNNGIAKELHLSKEYITIYGKDGKAWFKIDYSKKRFNEVETIHPRDFKRDADILLGKYFNDLRDNNPMTNTELMQALILGNPIRYLKSKIEKVNDVFLYESIIKKLNEQERTEFEGYLFNINGN